MKTGTFCSTKSLTMLSTGARYKKSDSNYKKKIHLIKIQKIVTQILLHEYIDHEYALYSLDLANMCTYI